MTKEIDSWTLGALIKGRSGHALISDAELLTLSSGGAKSLAAALEDEMARHPEMSMSVEYMPADNCYLFTWHEAAPNHPHEERR